MGDPIELAKKLGKLYKSYNPFTDIVLLLVYFAVLSGLYYVERTFIFGDPGALSMLICGIIGIAAVFFLYAAYASSKSILPLLFALLPQVREEYILNIL